MSTGTRVAAETAAEQVTRRGRRRKPPLSEGAKQERRLGEAFDPGEDAPAAVLMAARTRPSHLVTPFVATCKKHM